MLADGGAEEAVVADPAETCGKRFDFFLNHIVRVFSPDLFIIGGGASKKFDKFKKQLTIEVPLIVAEKRNDAGIIGAATYAVEKL